MSKQPSKKQKLGGPDFAAPPTVFKRFAKDDERFLRVPIPLHEVWIGDRLTVIKNGVRLERRAQHSIGNKTYYVGRMLLEAFTPINNPNECKAIKRKGTDGS